MTGIEDWNILVNEEFLVSVVHHTTLITSLPFVHTARRSYRWDEEMNLADRTAR
jgi:deoxyinosine 3'endonuclease (endonuclease V)